MDVAPFYPVQVHLDRRDSVKRHDLELTAISVAGLLGCEVADLWVASWEELLSLGVARSTLDTLLRQDIRGIVPHVQTHAFMWEWLGVWCTSHVAAQVFLDAAARG